MSNTYSQADEMALYEQGRLPRERIIALFQELVNTGIAFRMQGSYSRTARNLIQAQLVDMPEGVSLPEPKKRPRKAA